MNTKSLKNSFLLLITALIWGVAFVAQSQGGDTLGPYTFNCIRSFIGGMVLIPIVFFSNKRLKHKSQKNTKLLIIGGTLCGFALAFASTAQQLGIYYGTSVGKAGFLTTCYILIVPIIGLFFNKKCSFNIWLGVFLALIGLYLLCINDSISIQYSDLLILLCSLLFSIQIMLVDYYSPKVNGVMLACIEFFVCGFVCSIPMFIFEVNHSILGIKIWAQSFTSWNAWIPILYAGIMSCGVAYTLQIIAQNGLNPTVASLIMSLESVFSVLAGWIILQEYLSVRELIGCIIIFVAIIIAQINFNK